MLPGSTVSTSPPGSAARLTVFESPRSSPGCTAAVAGAKVATATTTAIAPPASRGAVLRRKLDHPHHRPRRALPHVLGHGDSLFGRLVAQRLVDVLEIDRLHVLA